MSDETKPEPKPPVATPAPPAEKDVAKDSTKEIGGRNGLDPVRYGDWEKGGIAVDF